MFKKILFYVKIMLTIEQHSLDKFTLRVARLKKNYFNKIKNGYVGDCYFRVKNVYRIKVTSYEGQSLLR